MWKVDIPHQRVAESVDLCCSGVMKNLNLRQRVVGSKSAIVTHSREYQTAAEERAIQLYALSTAELDEVSPKEMTWMYENRMVPRTSPGREIYDELMLLPRDQICPICNQRTVASLDHFLPKNQFPALALDPLNLVAVCQECNHIKLSDFPTEEDRLFFHPYFESADGTPWLRARVLESQPASVLYFASAAEDHILSARIAANFHKFGLAKLYASHSSRKLSSIRKYVTRLHSSAGPLAVRRHLEGQADSHAEVTTNNWETALYRALAESDWYINGGFAA